MPFSDKHVYRLIEEECGRFISRMDDVQISNCHIFMPLLNHIFDLLGLRMGEQRGVQLAILHSMTQIIIPIDPAIFGTVRWLDLNN